jgi:AraC-like DNA-binding protein
MNTRLYQIESWPDLAIQSNWSVANLAKLCNVSERTLHRHFLKLTGRSARPWLAEQRQSRALELLRNGSSIKETASVLGYRQPSNFTRQFKKHWGACPSLQVPLISQIQTASVRK